MIENPNVPAGPDGHRVAARRAPSPGLLQGVLHGGRTLDLLFKTDGDFANSTAATGASPG